MVVYRDADGESSFEGTHALEVVAEDDDVVTHHLKLQSKKSGVFRYAFRVYPWTDKLIHRQDFAYMKWL